MTEAAVVFAPESFWRDACVLVIAPHADDETFGCGGTIAKAKSLGASVYVLYMSVGDLVHVGRGTVDARTRAQEIRAATDCLGVDGYEIAYMDSHLHLRLDTFANANWLTESRMVTGSVSSAQGLTCSCFRPRPTTKTTAPSAMRQSPPRDPTDEKTSTFPEP